jgi:CheY-like chemotaxis protein/HPt (histidine-containing phosphotransfer) domain-containing protein
MRSGKLQLEESEFNINDIISYTLDTNALQAQKNNVVLSLDIAKDVPSKIVGDSLRLGQVLINLVTHGIEHIRDGHIEIFVDVLQKYKDRIVLQFKIIESGQRDEYVASAQKEGFGISIAQEYLEMMGSNFQVNKIESDMLSDIFDLNFALKDGQNKRQYRLPSKKFLNKNILIVEPSNRNAISLIKFFGYFHYKIKVISSFEDVMFDEDLNYENGSKYNIIVINQTAVSEYGVKKIHEFKKRSPNIKVVLINELYSGLEEKLIQALQVDGFLKMPATQQSVLNLIVNLYVAKRGDKNSSHKTIKDKLRSLKNKKVLLVEDNKINQKVIAELLDSVGIELTSALDGEEALRYVENGIRFDLILMDLNMPNIDGYEAALKIRQNSFFNDVAIIAISGDVGQEIAQKALNSGMQAYLSKPLNVDKFYHLLYKYLQAKEIKIKTSKKIDKKEMHGLKEEIFVPSSGLKQCHGDKEFFYTILQEFLDLYTQAPTTLLQLCYDNEFKKARHLAMDIKDVALNIGAYKVYESAASMEYEFEKGQRGNYKEHINHFAQNLQDAFFEIKKYLKISAK